LVGEQPGPPAGQRVFPWPLGLLALAVVAYAVAAWGVVPGFSDGIAPPQPYRWVSPPPALQATNLPAQAGHSAVRVGTQGVVDPGNVFTQDGQAALSFLPGSFVTPAGNAPVTVDIQPQATYPAPSGFQLATNVYCFTSSSPLVPGKDPLVTLQYPTNTSAPTDVYEYAPGGAWQKLGSTGSASAYYIAARASTLGCFAGGYAAGRPGPSSSGGNALPVVAGLAVAVVVLAGIPLLVLRRRGTEEDEEAE
jgi:hypothetical protein